jgi:hypothetical protein
MGIGRQTKTCGLGAIGRVKCFSYILRSRYVFITLYYLLFYCTTTTPPKVIQSSYCRLTSNHLFQHINKIIKLFNQISLILNLQTIHTNTTLIFHTNIIKLKLLSQNQTLQLSPRETNKVT